MEIRKAKTEDCRNLTELRIEMRKEREQESLKENEQVFYNNIFGFFSENIASGNFVSYVAVDSREIIATSGLCFYKVPPSYKNPTGLVAYITNMYTKKQYRKMGIATKLLDCLIDEAKSRDCIKITLNASDAGKPIYIKYGFKDLQNEMVYYIDNSFTR